MRILVACEYSGRVRDAFIRRGHDALSCDLEPTERPGPHYQGNVFDIIDNDWDMMIAFPPCTYLSKAGARWWRDPQRIKLANKAADFVYQLYGCDIPRVAIENPVGQLSWRWFKPDQIVHPWWFGDPYTKQTCLWLKNLPPLIATNPTTRRDIFIDNWSGVRDPKERARTFIGMANAMARQWTST